MHQAQYPVLPLSERETFGDFTAQLEDVFTLLEGKGMAGPILLFEVCEDDRWRPAEHLTLSAAPERMVIVSLAKEVSTAVFKALEAVAEREPRIPQSRNAKVSLKPNTPLKSVYRQMAAIPITVFSLTLGNDADDATIFFLRTPFTIGELQKELPNVIIDTPGT
jgi:hypothetical protein